MRGKCKPISFLNATGEKDVFDERLIESSRNREMVWGSNTNNDQMHTRFAIQTFFSLSPTILFNFLFVHFFFQTFRLIYTKHFLSMNFKYKHLAHRFCRILWKFNKVKKKKRKCCTYSKKKMYPTNKWKEYILSILHARRVNVLDHFNYNNSRVSQRTNK